MEFRSPRGRTFGIPAFWDGGETLRVRFSPNETGNWVGRIVSNIATWNDKELSFTATESVRAGLCGNGQRAPFRGQRSLCL